MQIGTNVIEKIIAKRKEVYYSILIRCDRLECIRVDWSKKSPQKCWLRQLFVLHAMGTMVIRMKVFFFAPYGLTIRTILAIRTKVTGARWFETFFVVMTYEGSQIIVVSSLDVWCSEYWCSHWQFSELRKLHKTILTFVS